MKGECTIVRRAISVECRVYPDEPNCYDGIDYLAIGDC